MPMQRPLPRRLVHAGRQEYPQEIRARVLPRSASVSHHSQPPETSKQQAGGRCLSRRRWGQLGHFRTECGKRRRRNLFSRHRKNIKPFVAFRFSENTYKIGRNISSFRKSLFPVCRWCLTSSLFCPRMKTEGRITCFSVTDGTGMYCQ